MALDAEQDAAAAQYVADAEAQNADAQAKYVVAMGCRYFVDSYVDTQGVRAKFRCKYDPTMLGGAEWEMLK